jgi:hypothetical protein
MFAKEIAVRRRMVHDRDPLEKRTNALMPDSRNQAAFVAALRQKAEELAANDPVLADLRMVGKTLVDEFGEELPPGAALSQWGRISREDRFH